jgi:hypothetical protein
MSTEGLRLHVISDPWIPYHTNTRLTWVRVTWFAHNVAYHIDTTRDMLI